MALEQGFLRRGWQLFRMPSYACVVPQMMKCSMKGSAYQMSDEQRHPTPEDLGRYGLEVTLQDLSIELCLMGQQDLSYQRSWY